MRMLTILTAVGASCFSVGCAPSGPAESDRAEILALFEKNLNGLRTGDADAASAWAGGDSIVFVGEGGVVWRSSAEVRSSYERQFLEGRYVEASMDDPPLISFSDDGRTAWYAITATLVYEYRDSLGVSRRDRFRSSELGVLQKTQRGWVTRASAESHRAEPDT